MKWIAVTTQSSMWTDALNWPTYTLYFSNSSPHFVASNKTAKLKSESHGEALVRLSLADFTNAVTVDSVFHFGLERILHATAPHLLNVPAAAPCAANRRVALGELIMRGSPIVVLNDEMVVAS